MDDILQITLDLAGTLERLGIPYLVGGSIASSLHGLPRATLDVDFVVQMTEAQGTALVDAIADRFYVNATAVRDAIAQRRAFNVIHLGSYFKADLFVSGGDAFSRAQLARGTRIDIPGGGRSIAVASPEDVVAHKLYWYRLGDESSERQWRDALGVLKVEGGRLDEAYLRWAAEELRVLDLLERALGESGSTG